jgi:hypothetical protein
MVVAVMPGALDVFPAPELVEALVLEPPPDEEVVVGDELFDELPHAASTSPATTSTAAARGGIRLLKIILSLPLLYRTSPDGHCYTASK